MDPAWRGAFARVLRVPAGFDFVVRNLAETVRAPIDLILFGRNLTATLPAEQLLPFFEVLCEAIADLQSGRRRKALVPFAESPWELALVRHPGDAVAVSLYRVMAPADVLADGEELPLSGLRSAVERAVEDLDHQAAALPHHPEVERWRRRLRDGLRRLGGPRRPLAPRPARHTAPVLMPVETSCSSGLWLVTELQARRGDGLLAYDGEEALDRHALLVPGTLAVAQSDGPSLRIPGRPLFMLEALLDACVALIAVDGTARDGAIELCLAPGGQGSIRLDAGEAVLDLRPATGDERTLRHPGVEWVSTVAQHVEDVVDACLGLNPLLGTNAHLVELRTQALTVRRRLLRDLATTPRVFAERLGEEAARAVRRSRASGGAFPVRFHDVRLLRTERAWSLALPTTAAREVVSIDDARALVRGPSGMLVVDTQRGEVETALSVEPGEGVCRNGNWVVSGGSGALRFGRLDREGPRWNVPTPSHEAVQSAAVHGETVVVAYRSGAVEGRAVADGALHWTQRIGVGVAPLLHTAGADVLIGGRDGEILCVSLAGGDARWRRRLPLPLRCWHVCERTARLALWHAERRSLSLMAVDVSDGAVRWSESLPADEICLDTTNGILALVDDERRRTLHRMDPRPDAHHTTLEVQRSFVPGVVACVGEGSQAWVTADGQLRGYAAEGGRLRERWCHPLDPEDSAAGCSLAVRGDILAVVGTRIALHAADTGRRVARLDHPFDDLVSFVLGPRASLLALERDDDGETMLSLWRTVGLLAPVG